MFYVYVHTVPNGKFYIGEAKDYLNRWNNGEGYFDNAPFYKDIKLYGWKNIKHEIIAEFEDRESALRLESVLIALLKTEKPDYGYNQTDIYKKAMKHWNFRRSVESFVPCSQNVDGKSFFEQYNLPVSACIDLIEQWIFNEKHRIIAKRKLIDGITYEELSKEVGTSVIHLKRIIKSCCNILSKHL